MASWSEIEAEAPELTSAARELFDAFTHKTLATLRKDGSPRVSGSELNFTEGEVWMGSMWRAMKALDLQRDPRFAVHSGSPDPDKGWSGDAKFSGRVEEITDPERVIEINGANTPGGRSHIFRCDIDELVVVKHGEPADHLVITSWHPRRGVEVINR